MTNTFTRGGDDQRSWGSAAESYTVEKGLNFGSGRVEIRQYVWLHSTVDVWTPTGYHLDLALTPRPGPTHAAYLDADRPISDKMGKILFVPPGRRLRSGGGAGTHRNLQCTLSPAMVDGLLPRAPTWDADALIDGLQLGGLEIEWLLFKMTQELRQGGFGTEVMVEALAHALAVALIRQFGLEREEAPRRSGGLAPWRMRMIRERVHADQPAPGLAELAELCGLSVRHLGHAFKIETGQTVAKFVEEATVERARDMLSSADLPIAQIAKTLGFSSSASFAHAFRRATGMRPSEVGHRRRARSGVRNGAN